MGFSEAMRDSFMDATFSGGAWVQLHEGSPGTEGTGDIIAIGRIELSFSPSSNGKVRSDPDSGWGSPSTTALATYFTLWDAETDGDLIWIGALLRPIPIEESVARSIPSEAFILSLPESI